MSLTRHPVALKLPLTKSWYCSNIHFTDHNCHHGQRDVYGRDFPSRLWISHLGWPNTRVPTSNDIVRIPPRMQVFEEERRTLCWKYPSLLIRPALMLMKPDPADLCITQETVKRVTGRIPVARLDEFQFPDSSFRKRPHARQGALPPGERRQNTFL